MLLKGIKELMTMSSPMVSVVICEHNTPLDFLNQAIASVVEQTYTNFEIIFVDDETTTDYCSLSVFSDERIKVIKNSRNIGLAASRNVGIQNSSGKYIAIMDTDDICMPERFAKQVEFLENNQDVVVCGTWFQMFGDKNEIVKRVIDDNEYYRCCLLFGNVPTIINPSTMIRKDVLVRHNVCLDESLTSAEDYDLWVSLSNFGIITNLKEVLLKYRIRKDQMSERFRTYDLSDNGWKIFKKQLLKIGYECNEENERFLRMNFLRKEVNPYKYFKFLMEILKLNETSKIYDQQKLEKRVFVQWRSKIYSIKNPFKILALLIKLPFKQKRFLIKTEFGRLNRKKMKQNKAGEVQVCE